MGEKLHGLGVGRVFRYDTKSMKLKEKLINLTSSKKKKKLEFPLWRGGKESD